MTKFVPSVLVSFLLVFPYCSSQAQQSVLGILHSTETAAANSATQSAVTSATKSLASVPVFSTATVLVKRVSEVNLLLTVKKRKWFGRDLTKDDFAITDSGAPPREITKFQTQSDLPLRIALVIDSSDSVGQKFQYERKSCLTFLRRNLRAGDLAFVVIFNEAMQVMGPPTADLRDLAKQIRKTPTSSHTALYDAVVLASRQLNQIHDVVPTRKIIVVLSDGEENHSSVSLEDAINEALLSESVIYSVSANSADDSTPERYLGDSVLQQLADATGGDFLRGSNDEDTYGALRKIEAQLRRQYMVSYKPARETPDGSFHMINVSSDKGFKIHHRRGYFAR